MLEFNLDNSQSIVPDELSGGHKEVVVGKTLRLWRISTRRQDDKRCRKALIVEGFIFRSNSIMCLPGDTNVIATYAETPARSLARKLMIDLFSGVTRAIKLADFGACDFPYDFLTDLANELLVKYFGRCAQRKVQKNVNSYLEPKSEDLIWKGFPTPAVFMIPAPELDTSATKDEAEIQCEQANTDTTEPTRAARFLRRFMVWKSKA